MTRLAPILFLMILRPDRRSKGHTEMSNSIKKTASGALVFIIGFLFGLLMSIYGLKVCLATLGNHWDVQLWAMIFSLPIIGFIAVRSGILFIDMDNGRFNSN